MDEQVRAVINAIPYGKDKAISREALASKLGVTDRKAREHIEQARREGYFIINDQDGGGYYRSADIADLERQYRQDKTRALSILARCKDMRKVLKYYGKRV